MLSPEQSQMETFIVSIVAWSLVPHIVIYAGFHEYSLQNLLMILYVQILFKIVSPISLLPPLNDQGFFRALSFLGLDCCGYHKQEYIDLGRMKPAISFVGEDKHVYCLAHHPVIKKESKMTEVHLVFDALMEISTSVGQN